MFKSQPEGEEKKKNSKKKKETKPSKTVLELLPQMHYDEENECYVLNDGSYLDLIQIVTKDLASESEQDKNYDAMKYAKLYKTYADDIKIVVLNYPSNTSGQQKYWKYKLDQTKNKILAKVIQEKLYQLQWLEKNTTSREFYIMYFAKDFDAFDKNRESFLTTLATGRMGLIHNISHEKKEQILYKVNNKCAEIF